MVLAAWDLRLCGSISNIIIQNLSLVGLTIPLRLAITDATGNGLCPQQIMIYSAEDLIHYHFVYADSKTDLFMIELNGHNG